MACDADGVLEGLLSRLQHVERVESLDDVRAVLDRHAFDGPTTLDLLGHSTTAARLLQLGRSIIDMCDPPIARFFEALARDGVEIAEFSDEPGYVSVKCRDPDGYVIEFAWEPA